MDGNPLAVPSLFLDPAAFGVEGPKLIVDGVESNELEVPIYSIARVEVNKNPYTAEFGRSGKGRIEVTTRRGSRHHYRADFSVLLRNSALDARNAFAKTKPLLQRAVPEFDLYGPLGRKLVFYLAGRYYINNESAVIHAVKPAGRLVENFKSPDRNAYLLGRLDFKLASAHRLTLAYRFKNKSRRDQGVGGFNLSERAMDTLDHENEVKLLETATFSPKVLNELRLAAKVETDATSSRLDRPAIIVLDAFSAGGAQVSQRRREVVSDLQDIVSLVRGKHTLRFGAGIRPKFFHARDASDFGGTFTFSSLATFNLNHPFLYTVNRGDPEISYRQHEFHVFLQDEIRVRPDFSLSLGVRHEIQTGLPDHNNFGPRLAFAYSPGGRQLVLRGGAGVFYERQPARFRQDSLLYDGSHIVRVVVSNPGFPDPFGQAGDVSIPRPSITRIAPGIRTPYLIQQSFSVEQKLGEGQRYLTIEYTGIRGVKLYRARNVNAPLPGTNTLPDSSFLNINQFEASGTSRAHGLTVHFQGQFGRGLDILSQYTLSRVKNDTGGVSSLPADNYDLAGEWGRADYDRRHRFNFAGIYRLPLDFRVSGIVGLSSGAPFNITTGYDDNQDTVANDRPPGVSRNTGRGPGSANVDARLSKRFRLERGKQRPELELGFDAFNLFNHVNFKR
ncbi:MAG: hypothetical protein DMG07_24325 [Acidobacteria bacterium]|nr:MAG: hypothetical protein DMG07_24325 [Acidobacteriota bacterium]